MSSKLSSLAATAASLVLVLAAHAQAAPQNGSTTTNVPDNAGGTLALACVAVAGIGLLLRARSKK